jgi:LCP family protein required for cell wall assembly
MGASRTRQAASQARRIRPATGPTDRRRLVAATLSALIPGLGQLINGRSRLAARLAVPLIVVVAVTCVAIVFTSPARVAAWAVAPSVIGTLLTLNLVLLAYRLVAVGHAFFDGRYPSVPGRLGLVGLAVLVVAVTVPHVYAWHLGSAAAAAFARVFSGDLPGDRDLVSDPSGGAERINVLLVGVDKTRKRTATLTDTMIVASLDPVGRTVSLLSVPRDLVDVPLGNGDVFAPKLNSLLGFAERHPDRFPDGPMRALEDAVGALLGIPIHYYARMDFGGFIAMIDAVGGVEIDVEKGFVADAYDGYGLGERGWSIEAGRHRLDGANALAYARARKASGESDFTRAARQQQILVALRDQVMRGGSLLFELPDLLDAVGETVVTDLPVQRLPELAALLDEVDRDAIVQVVIRAPLIKARQTRYGASQKPDLAAIRLMAIRLFPTPGIPPTPWPTPKPRPSP